jgi:Ca2+-binding RTX toxin-like protein
LTVATIDASPAPGANPATPKSDNSFKPVPSPVRDPLGNRPANTLGLVNIPGAGSDHIEGNGSGIADGTPDIIFADHGEVIQLVIDPNRPFALDQKIQTTFLSTVIAINSVQAQTGGDDVVIGSEIDDVIIGGAGNDALDGGAGDDLIFGDNVNLTRMGPIDGNLYDNIKSLRFQTLAGTLMYSRSDRAVSPGYDANLVTGPNSGVLMVSLDAFGKPIARELGTPSAPVGALKVVAAQGLASDGSDYIEGGGGCDTIFGGLGQDDIVGGSSSFFGLITGNLRPDGADMIFGGSGEQIDRNDADLAGDGTTVYGRHTRDADVIVGDNGDIVRLVGVNGVDLMAAHPISLSDPAVFGPLYQSLYTTRNGMFLSYTYDRYQLVSGTVVADYAAEGKERIVVRGVSLLDYTPGGPDYKPALFDLLTPTSTDKGAGWNNTLGIWSKVDIGGADEVHGETGDDTVYLGGGNDIAFGDAESDDIIGGWGSDWISGGTGEDGILGDDGRIFTSRNTRITGSGVYGSQNAENLFGVWSLLASDPDSRTSQGNVINEFIYTPGHVQEELINVEFELIKSVDLTPFDSDSGSIFAPVYSANPVEHNPLFADDVIFGGLGNDSIHGGSGDDAIGGQEALPESYVQRFEEGELVGLARTDFTRPWNPSDILIFGDGDPHWNEPKPVRQRTGEFWLYDEYDPRRVVLFEDDGAVWKTGTTAGKHMFFLNALDNEGVLVGSYTQFNNNGTPVLTSYLYRVSDGDDVIFGDMGNDWIVGGTGRDHLYGGFGNDLLNADDVTGGPGTSYDTTGGLNDAPETHTVWEDRVFGGAGLDILIGNTGGDRLIDHLGEFNSYIVPFAPFGIATVSRQVPPQLWDFLTAQAASDGVDLTRTADIGPNHESRYSHVMQQQGNPYGELGLVTQKDHGFWQDQSGPPTDPQAGNIPGGRRDILRTADFNDRTNQGLVADTGNFTASNGVLNVASQNGTTKASGVFLLDDYLPTYYEVSVTLNLVKPLQGWKANGYVVFDYYSDTDFKFAGINVSTNKIEMGYVDESGWHYVVQSNKPVQLKAGQNYDVLVAVNGTNVTVSVAGVNWFSYTFTPRLDVYGVAIPLNRGMVGVAMDGSKGTFDNFRVQILPPTWTLNETDDFAPPVAELPRVNQSSGWVEASGKLTGTVSGTAPAVQTVDLNVVLLANSTLEMEADIKTPGIAGFVFDRYDALNYKFVALDVAGDRLIIGHATSEDGQVVDASYTLALDASQTNHLRVTMQGAGLGVNVNGANIAAFGFNAVLVDGAFGLTVLSGQAVFDNFRLATDDQQFNAALKLAASDFKALSTDSYIQAQVLADSDLQRLFDQAVQDWTASGLVTEQQLSQLVQVNLVVSDLEGSTLARANKNTITIDATAAGAGWYIDGNATNSSEFADGSVVTSGVDLLTVLRHEIGHLLGYEHDQILLMGGSLNAGTRISVQGDVSGGQTTTADPAPTAPVANPTPTDSGGKGQGKKGQTADAGLIFDPVTGALLEQSEARLLFAARESQQGDAAQVLAVASMGGLARSLNGKRAVAPQNAGQVERRLAVGEQDQKPLGLMGRLGQMLRRSA